MNDQPAARPGAAPGLCGACAHARRIANDRGSAFVLCERSREDPAFPRYPRLPVLACAGFDLAAEARSGDDVT